MNDNMIFRSPTRTEVMAIMAEADRLRAEAVAGILRTAAATLLALPGKLAAIVTNVLDAIHEGVEAQERYNQLSRMSDRELADMGINRGDIPAVVAGVYQSPATEAAATSRPVETTPDHAVEIEIRKAA